MRYIRRLGTLVGVLAIAAVVAGPASAATGDVTGTIDAGGGGTPCPFTAHYNGTMPPASSGTVTGISDTGGCTYGGSIPITISNQTMTADFQSGGDAELSGTITFDAYGGIFVCQASTTTYGPLAGSLPDAGWSGPDANGDYPFSVSNAQVAVTGAGGLGCPLSSPIGPVTVEGVVEG